MQYYIGVGNERRGPFERDQLLAQGVQPETLIWHQGLSNWVCAAELAEIKELLASIPPPISSGARTRRKASPPWWRNPVVLVCGGVAGLLFIALADWIIVKINNREAVKRIEAQDNYSLEFGPSRAYKRGREAEMKGDFDKAIADYTVAIRLKSNDAKAYYDRGLAYDNKGNFDKAITDYTEAIRLNSNAAMAYNNRGNCYHNKGDFDKAIADLTEAIRLNPDDAMVYYNRGLAYDNKGDFDKAITDYTDAIRLKPPYYYPMAYNNRGVAYDKKGEV